MQFFLEINSNYLLNNNIFDNFNEGHELNGIFFNIFKGLDIKIFFKTSIL